MTDFPEIAALLMDVGRRFDHRGWVLGTSGNFSAVVNRDPLRLAITSSGAAKGQLTRNEILELDSHGAVIGGAGRPSAEALHHVEIVQNPDAGSVLHTHSTWSTIVSERFGDEGGLWIQGYEMLKGLEGVTTHQHREWIPILPNTQDMRALAADLRATLAGSPGVHGVLIRRHGLYTWGTDVAQATRHVEILEFLLEIVART
jgi:methylthioribulose-1-phosphate dehydratase